MNRIPVYLSGASAEHARVAHFAACLDRTGLFTFPDSWWVDAAQWTGTDAQCTRDAQRAIAREHLTNITRCRIFWMLWPQKPSHGAPVELGAALMHRWRIGDWWARVVVTGPGSSASVFTGDADFRDESDSLGLVEVCRLAREFQAGHELAVVDPSVEGRFSP